MSEWQELKLSEFVDLGKDQFKPNQAADFNYIGLEHIEQEKLRLSSVGHSSEIASNKFFFKAGDVLFGKLRPYFRKVVKTKFDGVCSTDIWVVRAKKDFSQDFVFYFLANWEFIDTANAGDLHQPGQFRARRRAPGRDGGRAGRALPQPFFGDGHVQFEDGGYGGRRHTQIVPVPAPALFPDAGLRPFGYPPDMQLLATETVLKQAEMIADELAG